MAEDEPLDAIRALLRAIDDQEFEARRRLRALEDEQAAYERAHRERLAAIEGRREEALAVLALTEQQRKSAVELAGSLGQPARERSPLGRPPKAPRAVPADIEKGFKEVLRTAPPKGRRGRKPKMARFDRDDDPGGPPSLGAQRDQPPDDDELTGRDDL